MPGTYEIFAAGLTRGGGRRGFWFFQSKSCEQEEDGGLRSFCFLASACHAIGSYQTKRTHKLSDLPCPCITYKVLVFPWMYLVYMYIVYTPPCISCIYLQNNQIIYYIYI
jgi:hypothetical protein